MACGEREASGPDSDLTDESQGFSPGSVVSPPGYVGAESCGRCHLEEMERWRGSHHDLAMQPATPETVRGDFRDARFTYYGVTSHFFRQNDRFMVRTDGPGGQLQDYEIAYAFGAVPLQQYLIRFPGGRLQALGIAWDTRPAEEGGQRWFHLYPDEEIGHEDVLHWTASAQNWNFMCAECHSTRLEKNYDLTTDSYETAWSEIDVSCEACHGPGSIHVERAEAVERGEAPEEQAATGLVVELEGPADAAWVFEPEARIATRKPPRQSRTALELCARCHSRRSVESEHYVHGRPLMDTHRPHLIDGVLYHVDGQIDEEVYVYGSFLQSKMYGKGVTCSDCHDSHNLELYMSGNALCTRCHLPTVFDTPSHHFHKPDSTGASCVACHMPGKLYMVVDLRHDHSLRNPRPDLSLKLGTLDACSGCHADQPIQWSADAVVEWYGPKRLRDPHFGEALHAGFNGGMDAEAALMRMAEDPNAPAIARASALAFLRSSLGPESFQVLRRALGAADPLIRRAALSSLEAVDLSTRAATAWELLRDPIHGVRIEAARLLAAASSEFTALEQGVALESAIAEYRRAQWANADRAESHLNLGVLHVELGELEQAEAAYRTALRLNPAAAPVYVNLADLYRRQGRDPEGEQLLWRGLSAVPDDADLYHSLGLLMVRQQRPVEALDALGKAARLRPEEARYAYVYGVALHSSGEADRAVRVLKQANEQHPGNRDLLIALATISGAMGSREVAIEYARTLVELSPRDPEARQLLEQLQRGE
jgi:Flp pilus assembly protein TadD